MLSHVSVRSRMLLNIALRFLTFWYMSVCFGTLRYVRYVFGTFQYVSVQKYLHIDTFVWYVSVHFLFYIRFDTIWYVLVGFRIKCPNLNQNVPKRTESYGKVTRKETCRNIR